MKAFNLCWMSAALALAIAGAARADDAVTSPKPVTFLFNVGAQSDYEFRGISQTDGRPSVFGGVDATIHTIGYAGAWASNIDFRNGTRLEYDLYAGVKPVVGPVTVDLGVIRYGYGDEPSGSREAYTEWKVAPSMAVGEATIGAAYFHSNQFFGHTGRASYYEINAAMPIGRSRFSVSGALGHQEVAGPGDYNTWNLGLDYAVNSHIGLDLRYWDTDGHGLGKVFDSKLVFGAKAFFP